MPPRVRLPNRFPLPQRLAGWRRWRPAGLLVRRPPRPSVSATSARVSTRTRQLTQESAVLWWRWRHLFLEAKRLELQARHEEGR